ncbi:MAG TPA: DUF3515 domain-containing protein [Nocardioidaceae bacterium]
MACLTGLSVLLNGCGAGVVEVDTPHLTGQAARTCSDLVKALPGTVDGAKRRSVQPSGAHAAAWGDPAIVLRCGVPMPRAFDRFASCQEANGVGWFVPEEQITGRPEAITMTTIGRAVNVEVSLPEEHWPPASAMVDLAPAIKKTVPETRPCV